MSYEIQLDPRCVSELAEIVAWYKDRSAAAAEKFETALNWVLETLHTGMIDYFSFNADIKCARVPDFPYSVYYSRDEKLIVVYIHAILHNKRDREFIVTRLYE